MTLAEKKILIASASYTDTTRIHHEGERTRRWNPDKSPSTQGTNNKRDQASGEETQDDRLHGKAPPQSVI